MTVKPKCEMCGDQERPPWLDDESVWNCTRAVSHLGKSKITIAPGSLHEMMLDAGVGTIDDLNNLPQDDGYEAYVYECPWLLTCDSDFGHGCEREFPGTEHYHVTSSR